MNSEKVVGGEAVGLCLSRAPWGLAMIATFVFLGIRQFSDALQVAGPIEILGGGVLAALIFGAWPRETTGAGVEGILTLAFVVMLACLPLIAASGLLELVLGEGFRMRGAKARTIADALAIVGVSTGFLLWRSMEGVAAERATRDEIGSREPGGHGGTSAADTLSPAPERSAVAAADGMNASDGDVLGQKPNHLDPHS